MDLIRIKIILEKIEKLNKNNSGIDRISDIVLFPVSINNVAVILYNYMKCNNDIYKSLVFINEVLSKLSYLEIDRIQFNKGMIANNMDNIYSDEYKKYISCLQLQFNKNKIKDALKLIYPYLDEDSIKDITHKLTLVEWK